VNNCKSNELYIHASSFTRLCKLWEAILSEPPSHIFKALLIKLHWYKNAASLVSATHLNPVLPFNGGKSRRSSLPLVASGIHYNGGWFSPCQRERAVPPATVFHHIAFTVLVS